MKLHKKQLGSALSLFLTLSILLSMLALPALAKAPAEGATLTLDDTLFGSERGNLCCHPESPCVPGAEELGG